MHLSPIEARVLGALMEKEATTPEYYPLSLNALVNACNQKNNREPVMQINEEEARFALRRLEDQKLAGPHRGHDSRVTKYEHRAQEVFNFTRAEAALICVLLLRGPQTPGELRGRTERIHRFEELDDVISGLQKLIDRDPSLVSALPRQPGTKEIRYAHLLSGPVEPAPITSSRTASEPASASVADRLQQLESEVAQLRQELIELREQLVPSAAGIVTTRAEQ
jgi:hypothetical protein